MLTAIPEIMYGNQLISGLGTNVAWELYETRADYRMLNIETMSEKISLFFYIKIMMIISFIDMVVEDS